MNGRASLLTVMVGLGMVGAADAADILINANIAGSVTWTKNNTYNLQQQIYILPGASLTIEAGTVVASTTDIGGSLAVCNGAQIFVLGTAAEPVIMTSQGDIATWVGGNPKTGTWREEANEWGNLTLMGDAYISENATVGNTPVPSCTNVAAMEGLTASGPGDTNVLYGGCNDDDDSGTIQYCSIRYGGKVIQLNNELNGLSLGGIGRDTDIHHVEIMNNVDDGTEVWGGTVNLKYLSIWNIGDDSIDIDQGYRGQIQNVLIVQGHSLNASQGGGVGDNCFETDGAEDSDWQPVTTTVVYNATVIGQPVDGDRGTAWRDNARVQYKNCIFMDIGEEVVGLDNVDGDGANGYGFNGTLTWAQTWTTAYNAVPATANDFTTGSYATNYPAQTSGKLAEIRDSVFFSNLAGSAYTQANVVNVFNPSNDNVLVAGTNFSGGIYTYDTTNGPIRGITRGAPVTKGGKTILPVATLDPRPANAALTSVGSAPNNGFFTPQAYRGAFDPACGQTWLDAWTASYAFGFTPAVQGPTTYCTAKVNSLGCTPAIDSIGAPSASAGTGFVIGATQVLNNKSGLLFYGTNGPAGIPFQGGYLCVKAPTKRTAVQSSAGNPPPNDCSGTYSYDFNVRIASGADANLVAGAAVNAQYWARDPGFNPPNNTSLTEGLSFTICP